MRFGTLPESLIPVLKPGYVTTKRQDKLRPKAFPCFFIGPSTNRPRDTYEVLLNSGSVVHSRKIPWTWLTSSVPVSAENVRSVSVSRKGEKLDPSRHGVVGEDLGVDFEESSESTGVRSSVSASLVAPTLAAVPYGRATPAGGRGTAAVTSLRGAVIKEIPGSPVPSSVGTPGGWQHRPGSTCLGALSAPVHRLNHRHMFLRKTRRMIALRPS